MTPLLRLLAVVLHEAGFGRSRKVERQQAAITYFPHKRPASAANAAGPIPEDTRNDRKYA